MGVGQFDTKVAVVVRDDLATWQRLNVTAFLISGVIIVEKIFSIPGMGAGFIDAFGAGDAPFLLAWFFVGAIAVIAMNLVADVIYVILDPRIRLS